MPLLSPSQIHSVLKEEARASGTPPAPSNQKSVAAQRVAPSLADLLDKNNLTVDEILDNLSSQMRSAEQAATRLKAAEIGLKLNGLLSSDESRPDFHVTIVINDSEFSGVNPILIPRS